LKEIGEKLIGLFSELQAADDRGDLNNFADLARVFDRSVDLFPLTYGERFYFDAGMIQASVDALSNQQLTFNPMIVPLHSNKWGHQSLPMPSWSKTEIDIVDFVLFPGQDDVNEINLLSYPFLLHELGHNIMFKYDGPFRSEFKRTVEEITNKLSLASIADQGALRLQSQQSVEAIKRYWEPTPDHKNWAYELAIDILALWLTGPAYLFAFIDETDKPGIDPFLLQDHPPYELRAKVLLQVAQRLGWHNHCDALNQLLLSWRTSQQTRHTSKLNRHVALSNEQIVESCVRLALETCETLQLPQCSQEVVSRITRTLTDDNIPELGLDLIIAAWLVHEERGDDAYQVWQSRTIERLKQYITQ
jgi:hypothetical protein